ncbi:MAG: phosphatase PAP2 family protein [Planctomycetes bacterium]|nr:phosphatase PAP2 family protein [Planctomycetota bacterium]
MSNTPHHAAARSARWKHIALFAAIALLGFAILTPLDPWLWKVLKVEDVKRLEIRDIYQVFRQVGHLSVWIVLAIASWILLGHTRHRPHQWFTPGLALILSPLIAGLCSELAKRLIGRLRPGIGDESGAYVFKPLFSAFTDDSNLGIPSSHATVAFAGVFMLIRLYPMLAPLALPLALGCAITRLLTGAHYSTDVWAGMCIAYASADVIHRLLFPRTGTLASTSSL